MEVLRKYGRGMPRPYNNNDPIANLTSATEIVTHAMGRGMPRPYNNSDPIANQTSATETVTQQQQPSSVKRKTQSPNITKNRKSISSPTA